MTGCRVRGRGCVGGDKVAEVKVVEVELVRELYEEEKEACKTPGGFELAVPGFGPFQPLTACRRVAVRLESASQSRALIGCRPDSLLLFCHDAFARRSSR